MCLRPAGISSSCKQWSRDYPIDSDDVPATPTEGCQAAVMPDIVDSSLRFIDILSVATDAAESRPAHSRKAHNARPAKGSTQRPAGPCEARRCLHRPERSQPGGPGGDELLFCSFSYYGSGTWAGSDGRRIQVDHLGSVLKATTGKSDEGCGDAGLNSSLRFSDIKLSVSRSSRFTRMRIGRRFAAALFKLP